MQQGIYKDPILTRIKEVLDRDGPKELKGRYGFGDPGQVNKSQLAQPMAFISYEDQSFMDNTSAELESTLPVVINVVVDMTKDFGQGLDAYSHMQVTNIACGRNANFSLREDSIVGALRKNQDLSKTEDDLQLYLDPQTPTRVEFDYQNRDKGVVTAEALIHFTVTNDQLRAEFM